MAPSSLLTVEDLRERWLPHKERLDSARNSHPTSVRFHRACSWLQEAEQLDQEHQVDQILIYQWIAFNALYGQWDLERHEPLADRQSWKVFLERMLELDESDHLISLLTKHRGLVLAIVGNRYLSRYFWQDPSSDSGGKSGQGGRNRGVNWYAEQRWPTILDHVVDRVYLLRCQLVHGAATLRSSLNRAALKHCARLMGFLVPASLLVWIDHGADEDWGLMCYPPLHRTPQRKRRRA